jgi:hypothetical protein
MKLGSLRACRQLRKGAGAQESVRVQQTMSRLHIEKVTNYRQDKRRQRPTH